MRLRTVLIIAVVGLLALAGGVFFVISQVRRPATQRVRTGAARSRPAPARSTSDVEPDGQRGHHLGRRAAARHARTGRSSSLSRPLCRSRSCGTWPTATGTPWACSSSDPSQGWGPSRINREPAVRRRQVLQRAAEDQGLGGHAGHRGRPDGPAQCLPGGVREVGRRGRGARRGVHRGRAQLAGLHPRRGARANGARRPPEALRPGSRLDWGAAADHRDGQRCARPGRGRAADTQIGWQYAHWIVAHSSDNGVERVSFGGQEWSAESGDLAAGQRRRMPPSMPEPIAPPPGRGPGLPRLTARPCPATPAPRARPITPGLLCYALRATG